MDFKDLAPAAIAFVFIAIVIGIGADVVSDVQDNYVTGTSTANSSTGGCNSTVTDLCGHSYNVSGEGLQSLSELSGWLPTIALVIAAAVVIGVLAYFRA